MSSAKRSSFVPNTPRTPNTRYTTTFTVTVKGGGSPKDSSMTCLEIIFACLLIAIYLSFFPLLGMFQLFVGTSILQRGHLHTIQDFSLVQSLPIGALGGVLANVAYLVSLQLRYVEMCITRTTDEDYADQWTRWRIISVAYVKVLSLVFGPLMALIGQGCLRIDDLRIQDAVLAGFIGAVLYTTICSLCQLLVFAVGRHLPLGCAFDILLPYHFDALCEWYLSPAPEVFGLGSASVRYKHRQGHYLIPSPTGTTPISPSLRSPLPAYSPGGYAPPHGFASPIVRGQDLGSRKNVEFERYAVV